MSLAVQRACFICLLWVLGALPGLTLADEHIVIEEGAFERQLSTQGDIADIEPGVVMDIVFHHSEYDRLHPYLIANAYCDARHFILWGSAAHPSQGAIELVCVKAQPQGMPRGMGGN